MCKGERLAYIKKGVVFHTVEVGPDANNSFAFLVDEKACASLAKPVPADAATLTKMAQDIARRLTAAPPKELTFVGSRLEKITDRNGVIEVANLIDAPAFVDFFKLKDFEIRGRAQGWFCGQFRPVVQQGVRVHVIYRLENGPPVLEFPIDNSVC